MMQNVDENALAEKAARIAWDFLTRCGAVDEPVAAREFIWNNISIMLGLGERNVLRLANRTITQYHAFRRERRRLSERRSLVDEAIRATEHQFGRLPRTRSGAPTGEVTWKAPRSHWSARRPGKTVPAVLAIQPGPARSAKDSSADQAAAW
jgi:hypothetical protein